MQSDCFQWDYKESGEGLVQAADPGGGRVLQRPGDRRGRGPGGQPQEDEGKRIGNIENFQQTIRSYFEHFDELWIFLQNFEDMGSIVRKHLVMLENL